MVKSRWKLSLTNRLCRDIQIQFYLGDDVIEMLLRATDTLVSNLLFAMATFSFVCWNFTKVHYLRQHETVQKVPTTMESSCRWQPHQEVKVTEGRKEDAFDIPNHCTNIRNHLKSRIKMKKIRIKRKIT